MTTFKEPLDEQAIRETTDGIILLKDQREKQENVGSWDKMVYLDETVNVEYGVTRFVISTWLLF